MQPGDDDPLINTVTVNSNPVGLGNDISDNASATVDLVHPSIDVDKVTDDVVTKVGDNVTYTVTVTNTSPDVTLVNITVSDTLKGSLNAFFSDNLTAGASENYTYQYTVLPADDDGVLENTVTVHANPLGLSNDISDNASATVDLVHPSIDVDKVADTDISKVGDNVTYTITVTNTGDWELEHITVFDALLGGDLSGDFVDSLAANATDTNDYIYTVNGSDSDPLLNTVTVHANPVGLGNDISDNASFEVDLVHPDFTLTKTADPTTGSIGDNITYTMVITNTGDVQLNRVSANDTLMGDITADFPATLAFGQSVNVTETRAIQPGDPNPLVNVVTAIYQVDGLPNQLTRQAQASVDIISLGEGLTPGFWKNHTDVWPEPYNSDNTTGSVFDIPTSGWANQQLDANDTLLEALNYEGGKNKIGAARILLRHAVAAVLNAAHLLIDYPMTVSEIVAEVNEALSGSRSDMLELKDKLDIYNNLGGGIDAHGDPI